MASSNVTLCPVQAAAAIVRQIRSYPGANNNTPISAIWKYNRINHTTSKQITNALQGAVLAIGEDSLHIATHKIGTYSIRLGAAMAMFLGGCPVFLIMMIGRWSSNAFLRYIRKQVEEFNHNVSQKCLPACSTGTSPTTYPQQFPTSIPDNLAEKIANMLATCRPDSQMLAHLAKTPLSWRHNFDPNTFFCVGICQHPPNFPL